MRAELAALLLLGVAPQARAQLDAAVRQELRRRLPAYAELAANDVRVPAEVLPLGDQNPAYRCWKLTLTGTHGRRSRELLLRLQSVRDAVGGLWWQAEADLAAAERDPEAAGRLTRQAAQLSTLAERWRQLMAAGAREGLFRVNEPGLFRKRRTVGPELRKEDYTMVYDDAVEGCPPRPATGKIGGT